MISEATINNYREHIIKQLTYYCGSKQMAEDAFQEACISCLQSKNEYMHGGLYLVAKRKLIDLQRSKSVVNKYVYPDYMVNEYNVLINYPDQQIDFLEVEEKERFESKVLNDINDILYHFEDSQQKVFAGRMDGLTFEKIAKKYNMKLSTALGAWRYGIGILKATFN